MVSYCLVLMSLYVLFSVWPERGGLEHYQCAHSRQQSARGIRSEGTNASLLLPQRHPISQRRGGVPQRSPWDT